MLELQKELGAAGEISIETVLRAPGVLKAPEEQISPDTAWPHIESGLRQRARLLDLVAKDIYGPRELMRDPVVLQAMQLADRLREAKGEPLEADEYEAIAEATGVAPEYLKFLEQDKSVRKARNFADNLRAQYFALENDTRRYVSAGVLGAFTALFWRLGEKLDALTSNPALNSQYGVFQTLAYLLIAGAVYNSTITKTQKAGAGSGLIFGATSFLMSSVFGLVFFIGDMHHTPPLIILWAALWAAVGIVAHAVTHQKGKNSTQATKGVEARQELLKQLVDLQDQLRQGSQTITFLSLDVVG
jgi:hypothetical protein